MSDFKELVKNLYTSKNRELTEDKLKYIETTYGGGKEEDFVKNFYTTVGEDLPEEKFNYIKDTYLKKKEPATTSFVQGVSKELGLKPSTPFVQSDGQELPSKTAATTTQLDFTRPQPRLSAEEQQAQGMVTKQVKAEKALEFKEGVKQKLYDNNRYWLLQNKKEAQENGMTLKELQASRRKELANNYLDDSEQREANSILDHLDAKKSGDDKRAGEALKQYYAAKNEQRAKFQSDMQNLQAEYDNIASRIEGGELDADKGLQTLEAIQKRQKNLEIGQKAFLKPKEALKNFVQENATEIASVSKPTQTPYEQLEEYTNNLYAKVRQLKADLGYQDMGKGATLGGYAQDYAIRAEQDGGDLLDELYAEELKLKTATKLLLLNRTPIQADETALGVLGKSFGNSLAPNLQKEQGTAVTIANNVKEIVEDAKIGEKVYEEQKKFAEESAKPYETYSAKWFAEPVGASLAIVPEFIIGSLISEGALGVTKIGKLLTLAEKYGKIKGLNTTAKYVNAINKNAAGKVTGKLADTFIKAQANGLKFGATSEVVSKLFPSQEDELNFTTGYFGGVIGKGAELALSGAAKNLFKVFGNKGAEAAKKISELGGTLKLLKDAPKTVLGEVGEEFGESLGQIYKQSSSWKEVGEKIKEQYGTLDKATEFVVLTGIMALGMGAGNSIGANLFTASKEAYNELPREQRAIVDSILDQAKAGDKQVEETVAEDIKKDIAKDLTPAELKEIETTTEETDEQRGIEEPISAGTDVLETGVGMAAEPGKEGVAGEDIQAEKVLVPRNFKEETITEAIDNERGYLEKEILSEEQYIAERKNKKSKFRKILDKLSGVTYDKYLKEQQNRLSLLNENPLAYFEKELADEKKWQEKHPEDANENLINYLTEVVDNFKSREQAEEVPQAPVEEQQVPEEITNEYLLNTLPEEKSEGNTGKVMITTDKFGNTKTRYIPFEIIEQANKNDKLGGQTAKEINDRGGYSDKELDRKLPNWRTMLSKPEVVSEKVTEVTAPAIEVTPTAGSVGVGRDVPVTYKTQGDKKQFSVEVISDGEVVGRFTSTKKGNDTRNTAEVNEELRGRGIGSLLLLKAIETADNMGIDFKEDSQSITKQQSRVYDLLEESELIISLGDGTWAITDAGKEYLQSESSFKAIEQSLKETPTSEAKPTEAAKVEEAQTAQVSQSIGTSPKNLKDLYNVNKDIFGLNRVQAFASAVAMDRMVGAMAKRAGITKAAMYGRIDFKKDTQENILKADNALYQGVVNGENVTLRNLDVDVVNGFYSPLEKIIAESKQDKMPAKQWIEKFAKGEEAKWTGLTDWLSQQEGSVSKNDILNYLKDNRINIVEVVKSDNTKSDELKKFDEIINTLNSRGYNISVDDYGTSEMNVRGVDDGTTFLEEGNGGFTNEELVNDGYTLKETHDEDVKLLEKAQKEANRIRNLQQKDDNLQGTKFYQYQLEGEKENYKEVLVTLPNKEKDVINDYNNARDNLQNFENSIPGTPTKEERLKYSELSAKVQELESKLPKDVNIQQGRAYTNKRPFRNPSHFDEPNILVHLRMNTRIDSEGNKVLFLEEVQSDWGQEGKKKGFNKEPKYKSMPSGNEFRNQIEKKLGNVQDIVIDKNEFGDSVVIRKDNKFYIADLENGKINVDEIYEADAPDFFKEYSTSIPSAPFVMDTNAWTKLGLKVALKEAIAQGATKIAWTTGEQQNDRYDLSKQVDEITYSKYPDGTYQFSGNKNDNQIFNYQRIPENKLEDYVGKEVANKIINGEGNVISYGNKEEGTYGELGKTLSGVDLKVGGKGMKGFYGSPTEGSLGIVGNVAKNLFKQEPRTVEIYANERGKATKDFDDLKESLQFEKQLEDKGERGIVSTLNNDGSYTIEWLQIKPSIQNSIDVTPALRAEVEKGLALFQKEQGVAKGAMVAADGRFIIYAITDHNISTPLHELAHVFEHYLTESESKAIIKSAGTKGWTTETSEYFARGFEKYLAEGKSPIPGLEKLFAKFKEWLTEIYNGIVGSDIDIKLNKPMRDIYAAMLGKEPASKTAAKPAKSERKAIAEAKIDDLAAKAKEFLRNKNLPEGTQVSGISQNKVIDLMASTVKALVNSGIEIAEAIKQVREFFEQDFDTSAVKDYQIAQAIARDELTDVAKDNGFSSYREAVFAVNKYVREVGKEDVITEEEITKAKEAKDKEAEAPKKGYKSKKKQAQEGEKETTVKETGRSKSYAEGRVPVSEAYNDVVNAQKEYYEQMNRKEELANAEGYLASFGNTEEGLLDAYIDMMEVFRTNPYLDPKNSIAIEILADRMFAMAIDFRDKGQTDKYNNFLEKSEKLRKEAFQAHFRAGQYTSAVAVFSRSANPDAFLIFVEGQQAQEFEKAKKSKPEKIKEYEAAVNDFYEKAKEIKKDAARQAVVSAPNSTTKVNVKLSDKLKARYEQGKARQAEALKKLGKINFFGSSGLSNEAIEAVGELVLSQFEQGIYKAATIIERIIEITEGKLTEKNIKDVYDAYKVNYKGEKLTLTELEEVLRKEEIAEKEPATDIDKALEKEREKLAKIKADYEQAVVDKADALVLKRAQQFVKDQEKKVKEQEDKAKKAATAKTAEGKRPTLSDLIQRELEADSTKEQIAKELVEKGGLSEREANKLAEIYYNKYRKILKEKITSQLLKDLTPKKVKQIEAQMNALKDKPYGKTLGGMIANQVAAGALDSEILRAAFAEKYGLPNISPVQADIIRDLARKARAAKTQLGLQTANKNLLEYVNSFVKPKYGSLLGTLYYMGLLTGVSTAAVNTFGNVNGLINQSTENFVQSVIEAIQGNKGNLMSSSKPAQKILMAIANMNDSLSAAIDILIHGGGESRYSNIKKDAFGEITTEDLIVKRKDFKDLGFKKLFTTLFKLYKTPPALFIRNLPASDEGFTMANFNMEATRELRKKLYAEGYRGADLEKKVYEQVYGTTEIKAKALQEAIKELKRIGIDPANRKILANRIAKEIIANSLDEKVQNVANEVAKENTFRGKPRGMAGYLSRKIPQTWLISPFVTTPSRILEKHMNYIPLYGILRYYGYGFSDPLRKTFPGLEKDFTRKGIESSKREGELRNKQLAQVLATHALLLVFWGLSQIDWEDEKGNVVPFVDASAGYMGTDIEERKRLEELMPAYMIRIGNFKFSYKTNPLLAMIALPLGVIKDAERSFEAADYSKSAFAYNFELFNFLYESNPIEGYQDFFEGLSKSFRTIKEEMTLESIAALPVKMAADFSSNVAVDNFYKQIVDFTDPLVHEAQDLMEVIYKAFNMEKIGDLTPTHDRWGRPVKRYPGESFFPLQHLFNNNDDKKITEWEIKNGIEIPTINRKTLVLTNNTLKTEKQIKNQREELVKDYGLTSDEVKYFDEALNSDFKLLTKDEWNKMSETIRYDVFTIIKNNFDNATEEYKKFYKESINSEERNIKPISKLSRPDAKKLVEILFKIKKREYINNNFTKIE